MCYSMYMYQFTHYEKITDVHTILIKERVYLYISVGMTNKISNNSQK